MSLSGSGINGYDFEEYLECDRLIDEGEDTERDCGFEGLVDVFVEDREGIWTCPDCKADHQVTI